MTSSISRYKTLTEQLAAYAESFRSAEIRFNEGVITSVDYVIAKNNLDRTNINLIMARYDYILRTKVLDYYQNKPLW
jgi:outer membrane protein